MPQMMPINWIMLMMFFIMNYLLFIIMNYYNMNFKFNNDNNNKMNKIKLKKNFYWKW
nr:ATP synthase F0 subunit 8 [Stomphastis sp.]UYL25748.1 ATP synthase F0 subunit 8 [Stomphastis sp.]UYL25761.1 ATP synthase F0 subunit 8 [Stomphastis sp.]UYL25774.1 ATP synthase F0 subunit 8 [Stomphastis sp.]UYL25787.1 ATP synthase F0 subunit 8 [Stomphastis sp.]